MGTKVADCEANYSVFDMWSWNDLIWNINLAG